jgi:hypothetical protein
VNSRSRGSGCDLSNVVVVWTCNGGGSGCEECCDVGEYCDESLFVGVRAEGLMRLCCRLFNVSAASISSTDMPDRTLAALMERSWSDLTPSKSIAKGFGRSAEERCEDTGEKGGGTLYEMLSGLCASILIFNFSVRSQDGGTRSYVVLPSPEWKPWGQSRCGLGRCKASVGWTT